MENQHFDERLKLDSSDWGQNSAYHVARYLFAADHVQGKRVLDAGTGYGYGAMILKTAGASEVQAIDIDAASIEAARKRFGREGLEYLVDDCEQLAKVRGPFDVICNFENIEHLNHPEAFLAATARQLGDDGTFFCSTPDRTVASEGSDKPSNPFHVKEWHLDEFRALLGQYFEDVDVRIQIENLSVARQRNARDQLVQHLTYLWGTPLVRASRALGKLFGQNPPAWDQLYFLPAPSPSEFPIVREPLAPLLGSTLVHYAICRKPRRA
jgi:SAM-dependent methyltransferase